MKRNYLYFGIREEMEEEEEEGGGFDIWFD
jgi:hypothetical protein